MKTSSDKSILSIFKICFVALGLLALSLQPLLAGNATGSNLGGAFAARQVTADTLLAPFYWIPSAGAGFAVSSGTTSASGAPQPNLSYYHTASTVTVGNGWGCALTGDTDQGDGSTVKYLVEISFPSSNTSSDIIVGLASANCTIGSVTHGTAASCTAMQTSFVASPLWSSVCILTLNSGATHPDIQFTYKSGGLPASSRMYCTVLRYTRQAIPCQGAGPCTIQGPVSTNQATVTVLGVTNASDQYVMVYQKNSSGTESLIGYLDSNIVVGANAVPVTWDATSLGAQIIATQTTPGGQEGCHSYSGAYVVGGGPNPHIRVSLNCRTSPGNLNSGPVGANSDGTGTPGLFFMPGPLSASPQAPQSAGIIVNPSTNWQTIVIDPRTVQKGWVWSGTGSGAALAGAANVGSWAGWESLIFNMDDLTDTGPSDIYLDNFYSGADPATPPCNQPLGWGFETNLVGDTQIFLHPAYSGYPGSGEFEGPDSALVSNLQSAGGTNANRVQFQFSSASVNNWVRLLADGGYFTYPQIKMDAPFQFDILLLPKGATQGYAVGNAPPLADQTNCPGTSFNVTATVTAPLNPTTGLPLVRNYTYSWTKSGSGTVLSTTSSYTKATTVAADAGTYSVVIGDGSGNTLTRQMILTVPSVLSIDSQPLDQGPYCIGAYASFSVSASISALCPCGNTPPLVYQWYYNGTAIAGATDSTYAFNGLSVDVTNAGSYTVVVSNTCALQAATSSTAKLYVCDCNASPVYNTVQNGLLGLYYTNRLYTSANPFADPVTAMNVDPQVNFDFGAGNFDTTGWTGGQYPNATDYFCVRWVGTIQAQYPGQTYTFHTTTDDGVRLYVDGNLIINKWSPQSAATLSGTYFMPATPVDIIMEYFENAGSAVAELGWEGACTVSNIIPTSAFNAADPGALPPFITLTAPTNNSTAYLGSPVTLTATVTQESASVTSVVFYNGAAVLATLPGTGTGSYTTGTSWTPPATGVYNISALVNYGASSKLYTVAVNKLTVVPPLVVKSSVHIDSIVDNGDGTLTIKYSGGGGASFTLMESNVAPTPTGNRDNWTVVGGNQPATPGSFTSVPKSGNTQFFVIKSN